MTDKTTDNRQWTDPADYGLPYVEVVPLGQVQTQQKEEDVADSVDVEAVKKETMQAVSSTKVERQVSTESKNKIEVRKSSNTWIWIAMILAISVVFIIIWQMNKTVVPELGSGEVVAESSEEPTVEKNDEVVINSTPSEETQNTDSQEIIPDSISSVEPVAELAQTGTTIASSVSGTLVRVEEKADRAQFYIIVGSLPNEAMALEEANKYLDKVEQVYLITPYEDVTNYRLAIGTSRGWTAINEELARLKDQYSEDLWILKY